MNHPMSARWRVASASVLAALLVAACATVEPMPATEIAAARRCSSRRRAPESE